MKKIVFVIITILSVNSMVFSQFSKSLTPKVWELKNKNVGKRNSISVIANVKDSIGKITIYLINKSDKELMVNGFYGTPQFITELKSIDGQWKKFDLGPQYCGTGYQNYSIPSNHFSAKQTSDWIINCGEFKTKLRYKFVSNNKVVYYSNEIEVQINPDLFLPHFIKSYEFNSDTIDLNKTNPIRDQTYPFTKAKNDFKFSFFEKSFKLANQISQKYPNYSNAKVLASESLLRMIEEDVHIDKLKRIIFLSKAYSMIEFIPKHHSVYQKSLNLKIEINSILPSIDQFEKIVNSKCKNVNSTWECKEDSIINERVKIRIKN